MTNKKSFRKRHASKRLEERYGSIDSNNLLKRLEQEILNGNFFVVKSYPDSTSKGYVSLDGSLHEVVFNQKTSKIITVLPKGSLSSERTRLYQGRCRSNFS